MYSKIIINGELEIVTGLHIGTGGEFSAIGAVDSPVIRDKISNLPMIPGSTLKGKMRSLMARRFNTAKAKTPDNDAPEIVALFGGMKKQSRLIFSDMYLTNYDEIKKSGLNDPTEIKYENTINRLTSIANPRQIERVIRQSKFGVEIIYTADDDADIESDIKLLAEGMKLLQYDYIGGHGSRGYGKVKFNDLNAQIVIGDENEALEDNINDILKGVSNEI
mgnify:FL=1